jgi:hypothetical protein
MSLLDKANRRLTQFHQACPNVLRWFAKGIGGPCLSEFALRG